MPSCHSSSSHEPILLPHAHEARRLTRVFWVVLLFFWVELIAALLADSVVLKADALHLLMDILGLGVSLVAMRLALRKPTEQFTFGLQRAEPLAALCNALLVLMGTVHILSEGVEHLHTPHTPSSTIMFWIAGTALLVNGWSAWILHRNEGGEHSHGCAHPGHAHGGATLNLRGARLHLLGDALGSLSALLAAGVLRCGGPAYIDVWASFLVAAILLIGSLRLVRDAVYVLLEAAPVHLSVEEVRRKLLSVEGVEAVRTLHLWTLHSGYNVLSAEVLTSTNEVTLGARAAREMKQAFGLQEAVVQIQKESL